MRLSDKKKLEWADIIFDYGSTAVAPTVIAYDVTVHGPDLVVKQLSHPQIKQIVNQVVEAHQLINLETGQSFPSRPDIRAETRRKWLK
jgi:flavorubredoxin